MTRTLLLNASYEPLAVVPMHNAVLLILSEKAEVVEEDEEIISSASLSMFVPKVIRLKAFVKIPYQAKIALTRKALMFRDNAMCQYCGIHCPGSEGTVDHVIAQSRFASRRDAHKWENVVWACKRCNGRKSNKTLEQFTAQTGYRLTTRLVAPTRKAWLVIGIASLDPVWEQYLGIKGDELASAAV